LPTIPWGSTSTITPSLVHPVGIYLLRQLHEPGFEPQSGEPGADLFDGADTEQVDTEQVGS